MSQVIITNTSPKTQTTAFSFAKGFFQVLLGAIFLGLAAKVSVPLPFTPVPMTLQSLAVALLAVSLGPKKAFFAVCTYLFQATIGMPVIAGGLSNPFWIAGPRAGYLIGFALSSYLTGLSLERIGKVSFLKTCLALSLNEGIILTVGTLWLSLFLGLENAIALGCLPFLPGAAIKISIAASLCKPIQWLKSQMFDRLL